VTMSRGVGEENLAEKSGLGQASFVNKVWTRRDVAIASGRPRLCLSASLGTTTIIDAETERKAAQITTTRS
jgi:hypothetical protein